MVTLQERVLVIWNQTINTLIFFISTAFRFSLSFFMLSCPHLFIDDNLKKKKLNKQNMMNANFKCLPKNIILMDAF